LRLLPIDNAKLLDGERGKVVPQRVDVVQQPRVGRAAGSVLKLLGTVGLEDQHPAGPKPRRDGSA
jgi:hypothetical protein